MDVLSLVALHRLCHTLLTGWARSSIAGKLTLEETAIPEPCYNVAMWIGSRVRSTGTGRTLRAIRNNICKDI
jgi:hypothetical protein